MAAIGLVVAIPVTIAVRGGGDSGGTDVPVAPEPPEVGEVEFDRDLGVELRLPEGWKRKHQRDAVSFRSEDGSVLIAITAPGPARDVKQIQEAAVRTIKAEYRDVDVGGEDRGKLGERPARVAAVAARTPKNRDPVRILVATARGEKVAYLVEVFAAGADPNAALVEAQVLLNNLRLEG